MAVQSEELLEKIRQQFDFGPYPRIPIETSPEKELQTLFNLNIITPYYMRHQRVLKPENLEILDVGCGTGYETLKLAHANPGARIVGIDISAQSIELAISRFQFHGFENAEFHVLGVDDLLKLERTFDYINCDELLYLFPDPAAVLRVMGSVLKPEGIIRSNLHSSLQRSAYFRAQEMFQMMGLMDDNPEELEIELAIEIMRALKPQADLKLRTYPDNSAFEKKGFEENVLMNLLFQGDKGYTISDLFHYLREADLDFISMLNPRQWEILDLFKASDELPAFLSMGLESVSIEERLHLYELIQPRHRLLDFWCGHPISPEPVSPVSHWSEQEWQQSIVHLHPQLRGKKVKDYVLESVQQAKSCSLSQFLPLTTGSQTEINAPLAAALLPLWEKPCTFTELVDRFLKVCPVDLVTAAPVAPERASVQMQHSLMALEVFMHVLLEQG